MITTVCAAVIENSKLLLVNKKGVWILPGGKPEQFADGVVKDDLSCLVREFSEELSGTAVKNPNFYGTFFGFGPHTGKELAVKVYLASLGSNLYGPSSEISGAEFVDDFSRYNLSEVSYRIITSLKDNKYL